MKKIFYNENFTQGFLLQPSDGIEKNTIISNIIETQDNEKYCPNGSWLVNCDGLDVEQKFLQELSKHCLSTNQDLNIIMHDLNDSAEKDMLKFLTTKSCSFPISIYISQQVSNIAIDKWTYAMNSLKYDEVNFYVGFNNNDELKNKYSKDILQEFELCFKCKTIWKSINENTKISKVRYPMDYRRKHWDEILL